MTDDEQRRADLAQEVITAHLTRELATAHEKAMDAAGTADAEARSAAARQAGDRLARWRAERRLDTATAQAVALAVLQPMEDAYELAMHSGEVLDVDRQQEIRQGAAVTRSWLRDVEGYDIPDYEREPGL